MIKKEELLKNIEELEINDLPLKTASIYGEQVKLIDENNLTDYLVKNGYNIYDLYNSNLKTYGDVLKYDYLPDTCIINDLASNLGFERIQLSKYEAINDDFRIFKDELLSDECIETLREVVDSEYCYLLAN